MRLPNPVSRITAPGRSAIAVATTAAYAPSGWPRRAASTLSAERARTADDGLALVRDEERVDADHLARRADLVAHRQRGLVDHDPDLPLRRHLVQDAGDAASGRVLHRDDVLAARAERLADEAVQGRDVGAEVALEPQVVAPRHDRHPVVADGAGDDEEVARPEPGVGDDAIGEGDAGGVEDDAVHLSLAHHLRVARDDGRVRLARGLAHRGDDALEVRAREPLLEDDRAGEPERLGRAHHREVVHRAGDAEPADVAAREEDGVDDVRVGGDDEPAVADADRRAVVERREADAVHRRGERRGTRPR